VDAFGRMRYAPTWDVCKYSFNYLSSTITDDEGVENIVALLFRIDHPRAVQISGEFARAVQLFHEKPE